jgi:sulfite reductase (NADPH) hemoprotein beta-component
VATFARCAGKIPVRRIPEAIERMIAMYAREREEGESAPAFFARIDLARVTEVIGDLQRFTAADAVPADYIDLAESTEFAPEVMDGECSA